jgi:hypothetical protein
VATTETPMLPLSAPEIGPFLAAGEGVKSSHIVVRGRVPGVDQAAFKRRTAAVGWYDALATLYCRA